MGISASFIKATILHQECRPDSMFALVNAELLSACCCAWQPQPSPLFLCDHNHRLSVDASREERTGPSLCNFFITAA